MEFALMIVSQVLLIGAVGFWIGFNWNGKSQPKKYKNKGLQKSFDQLKDYADTTANPNGEAK